MLSNSLQSISFTYQHFSLIHEIHGLLSEFLLMPQLSLCPRVNITILVTPIWNLFSAHHVFHVWYYHRIEFISMFFCSYFKTHSNQSLIQGSHKNNEKTTHTALFSSEITLLSHLSIPVLSSVLSLFPPSCLD